MQAYKLVENFNAVAEEHIHKRLFGLMTTESLNKTRYRAFPCFAVAFQVVLAYLDGRWRLANGKPHSELRT